MLEFSIDKLKTAQDHNINSLIMEQASDIAEQLTELECQLHNIECYIETENESSYTEAAQDIFNIYYDKQVDDLYKLFNLQLKELK